MLIDCYNEFEKTDDGSIRREAYGADQTIRFVEILTDAIPFSRRMKLKSFPEE